MFRTRIIILAILCVPLLAISVSAQKTPLLTFDDLSRYKSANHTFRIFGTVIDIYKCPPCPPRAQCKPCFPDHVTIAEKIDRDHSSSHRRLRVINGQLTKFAVGDRYLFTVKVYGKLEEGEPITDVTLIRFEARPIGDPLF